MRKSFWTLVVLPLAFAAGTAFAANPQVDIDTTAGTIGDILALRAQVRGAAGIVTDGAIRDSAALARLEIPAYHAAVHPAVLGRRHVPWETQVAVACAGVTIQPGDIIVGDADGVVVLPPALAAEVLADAQEQERQEEFIAGRVHRGDPR